ncbi:hypothetical protein C2845_PM09G23970 [Panicum miliaceum]|uniref:Uncharacterized protein n=1 Tax=Panicum miliaceum TaxID=4540 RepID=A0A3L6S0P3_PANMI|nr:hypothetical protein C2845_PM09G23970 [Panicum miliaceum]
MDPTVCASLQPPMDSLSFHSLPALVVAVFVAGAREAASLPSMAGVLQDIVAVGVDTTVVAASVVVTVVAPSLTGRRSPPRHRSPDRRPGPFAPAPRQAPAISAGSVSSERTRTATPPHTNGLVLNRNIPLPAAVRLPTPTPPEEPPRRPLVLQLRHPGCTASGIGVIPDLNSTTAAIGNAGFGPQAGPSNAAITSFTAANTASGFAGPTMETHPSFVVGTRAARRGAPPYYNSSGLSSTAASAASATPSAPTPARLFGRVAATDRRPGIWCGTWSPAALGLSSEN